MGINSNNEKQYEKSTRRIKIKKSVPSSAKRKILAKLFFMSWLCLAFSLPLSAKTIFVAKNGSGTGASLSEPASLAYANLHLKAGDTALLRGGEYAKASIHPSESGTPSHAIVYKSYKNEKPVLTNVRTAIDLSSRRYIRIEGVSVDGKALQTKSAVQFWLQMKESSHCIIERCNFKFAGAYVGVNVAGKSHHNKFLNNRFDVAGNWFDDLHGRLKDPKNPSRGKRGEGNVGNLFTLGPQAHHNLVDGNYMTRGGHDVFVCEGYYNVVRKNRLDNDWSAFHAMKEGWRIPGYRVATLTVPKGDYTGGTGRNLFEENVLTGTGNGSARVKHPMCMKVEGKGQIVRKNIFYNNAEVGISTVDRAPLRPYSRFNKIYHNVFYKHGGAAFLLENYGTSKPRDNVFTNNIVVKAMLKADQYPSTIEIVQRPKIVGMLGNKLISNSLVNTSAGDAIIRFVGAGGTGFGSKTLSWLESRYPEHAQGNIEEPPIFAKSNPSQPKDFKLKAGSPQIDKGSFLTQVTSPSGAGKVLEVADAGYFCDGFGLVDGDVVQLEAQTKTAKVTHVDYNTNTISLSQPLTWKKSQGISLAYEGPGPDIGAFEFSENHP